MRLRGRLLSMSIIPMILSAFIIGFMIVQLLNIQSSSKNDVEILLHVEELKGDSNVAKQSLANYTANASEANKTEALEKLDSIQGKMSELGKILRDDEHKLLLQKASGKFETLATESKKAFEQDNKAEIKRQSIRISGVLNDIYMLDKRTNEWYEEILQQTETKIDGVVLFSSISIGALIVIMSVIIGIGSQKITKPLNEIVEVANKIANGDLTSQLTQSEKKANSKFEIDQLNAAFIFMMENLKGTVSSIEQIGKEVTAFTKEVSTQMENLSEVSSQVAESTEELAKGSESISSDIQSTASLMGSMSQDFVHVQDESRQASEASASAFKSVAVGRESLSKQGEIAQQLSKSTENIALSVKEFAQFTGEIESAAQSVRAIAEQTNLLALNAAIEAARAGEAGKGFAVVADEVRKLAEDSTQATHLITAMVSNIMSGLKNIVEATELGNVLSTQQEQAKVSTEHAFETIATEVTSIQERLEELVRSVERSNEMSNQVSLAVENISAITEETAAGTEEISASTEAQLNAFQEVNNMLFKLQDMTEVLKKELDKFTI
ncbi:methyl-accepting chemotaxis protein [Bacillaceae bacterium CLA-AA-H227]|uniref:Methyl-accepting chemotaxis protein n=1 Tax=Robertmurraya yapensis (ex Hitch et al 2024) TaxID=3133160 RepID=A0ACC6SBL2_9BACI